MSSLSMDFPLPAGVTAEQLLKLAKQAAELEKQVKETGVVHQGNQIILPAKPEKMTNATAMTILAAREQAAQQVYEVHEMVDGFPLDAAAAFHRAVLNRYGFVNSVTVEKTNMWGQKKNINPDMLQIRVGPKPDDIIQVPVGGFQLPGFDSPIESHVYSDWRTGKMYFLITGKLKAKDRDAIREIIADTRRELQENSIYKGKAILLKADEDGDIEASNEPEFIDVSRVDPADLILSKSVESLIYQQLFTLIQKTERCRALKVPLKTTALFEGPFGTGKTLLALVTAKICTTNGWTYVMVSNAAGLPAALNFARRYQPAVLFAEDIDLHMEDRDEIGNAILNAIDGLESKGTEVVTILTTNNVDKIHPAFMRPGRVDLLAHIGRPDQEAAIRLVRKFAGHLLPATESLDGLAKEVEGYIPAVIRRIVESAKVGMISHDAHSLCEQDLMTSAFAMKQHASRSNPKAPPETNAYEKLGVAFSEVMSNGPLQRVHEKLDRIDDRL